MLNTRNRIFDDTENVFVNWLRKLSNWGIRRSLRKNKRRFYIQIEDTLGYKPTEKEIDKHAEMRIRENGEVWFYWKSRYLFEWKVATPKGDK